jgi:cytochrome c
MRINYMGMNRHMSAALRSATLSLALVLCSPVAAQDEAAAGMTVLADEIVGDASAGERVFRRCGSCHEVGEGAENKVGPVLNGVVGRPAAAIEDYEYSDAMQEAAAGGLVWTVAVLQEYLEKPRDVVPGTKMNFPGLRSEEQRNDVIAYLYQASPDSEGE